VTFLSRAVPQKRPNHQTPCGPTGGIWTRHKLFWQVERKKNSTMLRSQTWLIILPGWSTNNSPRLARPAKDQPWLVFLNFWNEGGCVRTTPWPGIAAPSSHGACPKCSMSRMWPNFSKPPRPGRGTKGCGCAVFWNFSTPRAYGPRNVWACLWLPGDPKNVC